MSVVENLLYAYDRFELQLERFEIQEPGVTFVLGPSGSGKSTLLKCLYGELQPQRGNWWLNGENYFQRPPSQRQLGVVTQEPCLFENLSAADNVEFVCRARGWPSTRVSAFMTEHFAKLRMDHCMDQRVSDLSGGERQRVCFIRALAGDPKALILDEPFSALDRDTAELGWQLIAPIVERLSIPVIVVSHDERDLHLFAAKAYVLAEGRIQREFLTHAE